MILRELLEGVALRGALPDGLAGVDVAGLEYDSRKVRSGSLFFAFPGARADGRAFANDALSRGALAVVSELSPLEEYRGALAQNQPHTWIQVEHGRRALARAAGNFYGHPDQRVQFTGITGTNGKTTTSYLIDSILRAAGKITGLIGTIEYRMAGEVRPAPNTTPESLDILRFAAELEQRGSGQERPHLVAEVSSHALALGRVWGFHFHTAVFTNLTRDHLDFHGTMEEYAAAKQLLFAPAEGPAPEWMVLNTDDPAARQMVPAGAGDRRVIWYGLGDQAALRAENLRVDFSGLDFDLVWQGRRQAVHSPLAGRFNALNILAAAGAGISYGLELDAIAQGLAACAAVPGRFERVDCGQPFLVVVDYAHTDDALRNTIQAARELTSGRVITLFGCGGDRDRTKRPLMGMAAAEFSDFVVLTSDNPRSEDPLAIMNDALVGVRRFDTPMQAEPDRAKAIRLAIGEAHPGDAVLIAGKGHETYQVLKNETIHFDDRETAREVLESFGYRVQGKTES
jgi:UDP-N-acetylmuramoyl-L-alanyl-D-glutamate--2,6-diaminopimelate ligase